MSTGKPLEIIVDESLYDLKEINDLVDAGHTVKKLMPHGYDGILGPKASNLTAEDIKANPKLLGIALARFKDVKYPKVEKKAKVKKLFNPIDIEDVKEYKDAIQNQEAPTGTPAEGVTEEAPPRKRRTRRTKQQIADDNQRAERGSESPIDEAARDKGISTVDSTPIPAADNTGD